MDTLSFERAFDFREIDFYSEADFDDFDGDDSLSEFSDIDESLTMMD